MTLLFSVTDPRGVNVQCSVEVWEAHILANRPWMMEFQSEVEETIRNPTYICGDKNRPEREVYYRRIIKRARYCKVVARMKSKFEGEVISAFPTDSGKKGEVWLWP